MSGNHNIRTSDRVHITASGIGNSSSTSLKLKNVLLFFFPPELAANLLSFNDLVDSNYQISFCYGCLMQDQ